MEIKDLYLGRVVYNSDGESFLITALNSNKNVEYIHIFLDNNMVGFNLDEFEKDFSLTPPKKKKRFWIWDVKQFNRVIKCESYLDDNGVATNGDTFRHLIRKHENEFIDIEVDE